MCQKSENYCTLREQRQPCTSRKWHETPHAEGIALTPYAAEIVLTLHTEGVARNQFGLLAKDRRKIF